MRTVRHLLELKGGDVWCIQPDVSLFDALRMMALKDVGALLVMVDDDLVGIVSERDYARKVVLKGRTARDTKVSEVMTSELITVHPGQTIEECMELMTEHHIRHLPIVDNGRVLGVISIGDVVKDIIFRQRKTISTLEDQVLSKSVRNEEPPSAVGKC